MHGRPIAEPRNLGTGWVKFDYDAAFGRPVKIINDAAMQALGSYEGGKMLFLGLGTGLGSAMIIDGNVEPMELAASPLSQANLRRLCRASVVSSDWDARSGRSASKTLPTGWLAALQAEYVVIGGGNARKLKELPPNCRVGNNDNAFKGGFRLWETAHEDVAALNKAATKASPPVE